MTNDESIRRALDSFKVPVDDPVRALASDFARRTPEEQNLWLFVEVTRLKPPSRIPVVVNSLISVAVAAFVAVAQVLR